MFKRPCAGLLVVALLLSLCVIPAAATETYTVTLPTIASGSDTVAKGEDYTFTLNDNVNVVAYAEFDDGSICAAELCKINNVLTMLLPAAYITGNFEIKTFTVTNNDLSFLSGDGSQAAPYQIASELDLLKLMAASTGKNAALSNFASGKYFELANDIVFHTPINTLISTANTTINANNGIKSQICGSAARNVFAASFNGKNHKISGLNTFHIAQAGVGLIPTNKGSIMSLTIETVNNGFTVLGSYENSALNKTITVTGLSPLVNNNNTGTIDNCKVTATINSHAMIVGMIAAQSSGTITNCVANADIVSDYLPANNTNSGRTGIICGSNEGGSISNCTSDGILRITARDNSNAVLTYHAGGIAAYNTTNSAINSCTNLADIVITPIGENSGVSVLAGGITGLIVNDICYCANYGNLSCEQSPFNTRLGGITGQIANTSSTQYNINGCFNNGAVTMTGTGTLIGGGLAAYGGSTFAAKGSFSFVNGLSLVGSADAVNFSYVYTLANVTDTNADETTEEKELSAADFKAASLVTTLNTALGENIFVAGTDYPVFSWLAAPASVDLMNEPGVVTAPAASVATVTAVADGGTATITVVCDQACTVVCTDDNGVTYTRLNYDGTNGHVFTTDAYANGMTFVVAVKGDVSGDGSIDSDDFSPLVAAFLNTGSLNALNTIIGDINADDTIDSDDFSPLVAAFLGTGTISW